MVWTHQHGGSQGCTWSIWVANWQCKKEENVADVATCSGAKSALLGSPLSCTLVDTTGITLLDGGFERSPTKLGGAKWLANDILCPCSNHLFLGVLPFCQLQALRWTASRPWGTCRPGMQRPLRSCELGGFLRKVGDLSTKIFFLMFFLSFHDF